MYCRKCGNPLKETDFTCKVCGALQIEELAPEQPEREMAQRESQASDNESKKSMHNTEFTWNVYDFPKPRKTEELDIKWTEGEETVSFDFAVLKNTDKGTKTKTETIEATDESGVVKKAENEKEAKEAAENSVADKVEAVSCKQAETDAIRKESIQEIEKFFTLTKKNEEFQNLLDLEYERIKNRREGDPYIEPTLVFSDEKKDNLRTTDLDNELERMILEGTTPAEAIESKDDLLSKRTIPVNLNQIQQEAQKVADDRQQEAQKTADDRQPEAQKTADGQQEVAVEENQEQVVLEKEIESAVAEAEIKEQAEPETPKQAEPVTTPKMSDRRSEMRAARESLLRQLEEEQESLKKAEAQREEKERLAADASNQDFVVNQTLSGANAEIQVTVAVKANGGAAPQENVYVTAPSGAGESVATVKSTVPPTAVDTASVEAARKKDAEFARALQETCDKLRQDIANDNAAARVFQKEPPWPSEKDSEETSGKAPQWSSEKAPWRENTFNNLWPVDMPEEPDEEKRGGKAGKVILIIIAIILAVEIIALGIQYFAPDSGAAQAVTNAEVKIVEMFNGAVNGIKDFFSGLSGDEADGDDGQPTDEEGADADKPGTEDGIEGDGADSGTAALKPDPIPMADKTALIQTQIDNNKNIKEVVASAELKYKEGRTYGKADINNSVPIANNIWKTLDTGETLYYDQAIVGTLIAYNSQWIDYVNSGTKDVLDRIKKDSRAYRSATTFSQLGKITESFESLQIGELRQGKNGFYVWTKEQIQKTKTGKTTVATNFWIYYLEPVENEMKIVDFIAY